MWRHDADGAGIESLFTDEERAHLGELAPRLRLRESIGTGGMGKVYAADQRSLHRGVAVKVLKPQRRSLQAAAKLLTEGWINARLEHPNIAPVYDVGLDGDGYPMIMMKRIEGTPWVQRDARATQRAELDAMASDRDRTLGASPRRLLASALAFIWRVLPLIQMLHNTRTTHAGLITRASVMTGVVSLVLWLARRPMQRTAYNRDLASLALLAGPTWLLIAIYRWLLGVDPVSTQILVRVGWIVLTAIMMLSIDWRIMPTTLVFIVTTVVATADPATRGWTAFVAHLVMGVNLLAMFWPQPASEPAVAHRTLWAALARGRAKPRA